jgi:serine/threonine protein kinase
MESSTTNDDGALSIDELSESQQYTNFLRPGNMLGPYQIEEVLAQGAMGTVYLAEHIRLGRSVALKVLHQEHEAHRELVSRFVTEARAANQVDHANVVEITDFVDDKHSGLHYIVMEYLKGHDLAQLLEKERVLSPSRALKIARQVSSALAAAHRAGIIHRDLKPDNIFLSERAGHEEFVKILDFGVAKIGGDQTIAPIGLSTHMTTPGMMLGTPLYMSPEQAYGKEVDLRTDIYSLGVILYHMLTGRVPFEGSNLADLAGKQMAGPPVAPSQYADLPEQIPQPLEDLVMSCLKPEPEDRPASMEAVIEVLGRVEEGFLESGAASTSTKAPAQVIPIKVAAVLLLVSAILFFVAGLGARALLAGG